MLVCGLHAADLDSVRQLALSSPPEFAADALLRIVESKQIEDKKKQIALIRQAYDLASSAHFPVKMTPLSPIPPDSRQGALAKAYALNLDSLSLQSRAVQKMAVLDGAKAREMFTSIVKPELASPGCDAALTYDFKAYYQALAAVLRTFTAKERLREDHVSFLLGAVAQIRVAAETAPMTEVIRQADLNPAQREAVEARFHPVTAAACDANTKPKIDAFFESGPAQLLLSGAEKLRAHPSVEELASYEKDLTEWTAASEKSEKDYYEQKCIAYQAVVELIPAGPERDRALDQFINYVVLSNVQQESPVEWFQPVQAMAERVMNTNDGDPAKLLSAYEESGNPALALYAALVKHVNKAQPSWMSSQ